MHQITSVSTESDFWYENLTSNSLHTCLTGSRHRTAAERPSVVTWTSKRPLQSFIQSQMLTRVCVCVCVFQWDPSRLNDSSTFVLGSRANKWVSLTQTWTWSPSENISCLFLGAGQRSARFNWMHTPSGIEICGFQHCVSLLRSAEQHCVSPC